MRPMAKIISLFFYTILAFSCVLLKFLGIILAFANFFVLFSHFYQIFLLFTIRFSDANLYDFLTNSVIFLFLHSLSSHRFGCIASKYFGQYEAGRYESKFSVVRIIVGSGHIATRGNKFVCWPVQCSNYANTTNVCSKSNGCSVGLSFEFINVKFLSTFTVSVAATTDGQFTANFTDFTGIERKKCEKNQQQ